MKELSEYTFEEIEAEYMLRIQQRRDAKAAERAAVKRCRTCRHFGTVTVVGAKRDASTPPRPWESAYCPFLKRKYPTKNGKVHHSVQPSTKACERYEKMPTT